jgi:hypothetical protein
MVQFSYSQTSKQVQKLITGLTFILITRHDRDCYSAKLQDLFT